MPSTDTKLELKAKTSVAQTGSQPFVYAKGFKKKSSVQRWRMFKMSPASLQTFIDTRLALTPSVIPSSNYAIMVSDWNCFKIFLRVFCTVIIRYTEIFWPPCIISTTFRGGGGGMPWCSWFRRYFTTRKVRVFFSWWSQLNSSLK
jgi:hypothetical protein